MEVTKEYTFRLSELEGFQAALTVYINHLESLKSFPLMSSYDKSRVDQTLKVTLQEADDLLFKVNSALNERENALKAMQEPK